MSDTIANRMFDGRFAESELEEILSDANVLYERLGWDHYDCSLELHDVPDDYRLSIEAQKAIFDAGFLRIYVNHINKWETHYTFGKENKGWRVSYPRNRKDNDGILLEEKIDGWPEKWFETGYVKIVK